MRFERPVLFWLGAAFLLFLVIWILKDVLLPFAAGIVVAYFVHPLVDRLASWGVPRIAAAALIIGAVGIIVITALVFLVPLLLNQAQQLIQTLPGELARLRLELEALARAHLGSYFPEFQAGLERASKAFADNWAGLASWAVASLWTGGQALVTVLSLLLVTPLVAFYLLIDWPHMLAKIDGWLPRDHAPTLRSLAQEIDEAVSAFIRGQGTVCLILAVYYALALSLLDLNYGLLVGLATGVLSFIPFVGWALGFLTAGGLAVVQFWPETMPLVLVAAVYLGGQALDAGFLSPKVVGSKIGLHPVWLIFALFVFSYLFGILGVLVAVPLAAAIGVLVRFGVELYLSSSVYRGRAPQIPPG